MQFPTNIHDRLTSRSYKTRRAFTSGTTKNKGLVIPRFQYCEEGESCCTLL